MKKKTTKLWLYSWLVNGSKSIFFRYLKIKKKKNEYFFLAIYKIFSNMEKNKKNFREPYIE